MNDDINYDDLEEENDDENEEGPTRFDEVDLKYTIYTDEPSHTVYLKFNGFEDMNQVNAFAEYIESYLPLILYDSDTRH